MARTPTADSTAEELAFWQQKVGLTAAGSKEQATVENTIYQLKKRLAQQALHDDEAAEREKESLDRLELESLVAAINQAMRNGAALRGATT